MRQGHPRRRGRRSGALVLITTLCMLLAPWTARADGELRDVRALIYSRTAVELFWSQDADAGRVEIRLDGEPVGLYDARSHFREGLDPSREHVYELRLVAPDGTRSAPVRLTLYTGDHVATTRQVVPDPPAAGGAGPTSGPASGPAPEPEPTAPASAPRTVPADDGATAVPVRRDVAPGDCVVDSLATLVDCGQSASGYARLNVRRDLVCTGDACCPYGGALLRLAGVTGLEIVGNGHRLLRRGGHRRCSLVDVTGARGLTVSDWRLDDDGAVAPCLVADGCPRMVHVRGSRDVRLERVEVAHSKGYAIYVDGVDGFAFVESVLRDSGVLGLYIGHEDRASSRVRVERSTFRDNQTNALALLGVRGDSPGDNLVTGNLFERNHWRGQWPVAPRYGTGLTGGGQLYVARASGVTIAGNRILAGRCENCFWQGRLRSGVSGIELGRPGRRSVSDIVVEGNEIVDQDAWGVFANAGSPLDARVTIRGNRLVGNGRGLSVPGADARDNVVEDRP